MSTILFNQIVFGPIRSRRMGISLGVNLLPADGKVCSFDCIYCECGFNKDFRAKEHLPSRSIVQAALEEKLQEMKAQEMNLDVITFAGNGEPTLHPDFSGIIEDTILLRNQYYPHTKISVLSNGMHTDKATVFETLKKVDNNILKLDSAFIETVKLMDRPNVSSYSIEKQVELYKDFKGKFILQTMFLRGEFEGKHIDNTTEKEVSAWLKIVEKMQPLSVMIYTIDRETPAKNLAKVPLDELKAIASRVEQLGIKTNVAG